MIPPRVQTSSYTSSSRDVGPLGYASTVRLVTAILLWDVGDGSRPATSDYACQKCGAVSLKIVVSPVRIRVSP